MRGCGRECSKSPSPVGLAFQRENSGSKMNKQTIRRGLLGDDGKHRGEETWSGDEEVPFHGEWSGWTSPKVTDEQRVERGESHAGAEKDTPGRGNGQCKGLATCLRNNKQVRGTVVDKRDSRRERAHD